jgi:hypothetical protein
VWRPQHSTRLPITTASQSAIPSCHPATYFHLLPILSILSILSPGLPPLPLSTNGYSSAAPYHPPGALPCGTSDLLTVCRDPVLNAVADPNTLKTATRQHQQHPPGALPCGTSGQFSLTSLPSSVAHTLMLLVNTKLPLPSHCCVAARTCRGAH